MDSKKALIDTFKQFGVTLTTQDIPEVLRLGADTFLHRKQTQVPQKRMDEIYLILNEMRTRESELDSDSTVKTSKSYSENDKSNNS